MSVRKNRQWILRSRPAGMVSPEQFEQRCVDVPPLGPGQVLAQTLYLSFDPTQRAWMAMETYMPIVDIGEPMRAGGIAQVIESRHAKFKPGDIVNALCNWQEYLVFEPDKPELVAATKLPAHLDPALLLALSLTGLTAYFGLLDIGRPRSGDIVLVSGAAGATGSIAGQIAKIKGCRVIGIAGGAEKCAWLTDTAGFDAAIDYKHDDIGARLDTLCPDGINVYFDNVGGPITDEVLLHIAHEARVVLCGAISQYNTEPQDLYGLKNYLSLIINRGTAQGFIVLDYLDRAVEALLCLNQWVAEGRITQEIDIQEGFDNIPATLSRIFTGDNLGKQLLKLCDPPLPLNVSAVEKLAFDVMSRYVAWRRR